MSKIITRNYKNAKQGQNLYNLHIKKIKKA